MLTTTNDPSRQSKVYQKSVYKLDPDLYQAKGATFASCFYNGAAASGTSNTRKNLMRLQKYISVKSLHRLSLTSRSWFDAIHQSSLADPLWGFHLLRLWKRSEDDELFLHEIGVLKKPERPRTMLMKLTRQVGRVVLENIKVLLTPENWHLATAMSFAPTLTLQAVLRISKHDILNHGQHSDQQPSLPKADARADMFEQIAIIYNKKGEIVAVRAQELIRPIAEDQMLTDILHGMRSGVLATVECRRLRLFSVSNRLSFDQWHVLSANSRVVFDFFWGAASSTTSITATDASTAGTLLPRVWHQKILERMQKNMQHRLLGKESIQQVLKAVNDCNGPPQALVALEKFLTLCHTTMDSSTAASSAQTAKKRKEQQLQQHSPTPKTHAYST
uniref:F-box domain-containing protein n=1 Tax=Globisporangium ultimum (strain ATCC 200006 / CBS 805.95 / DAOM BR144) TaxID=431595 RepID=K3WNC4_GLOUD